MHIIIGIAAVVIALILVVFATYYKGFVTRRNMERNRKSQNDAE